MPNPRYTKGDDDEEYQKTLDAIDKGTVKQDTMADARRVPPQKKITRPRTGGFNIGGMFRGDKKGP